MWPVISLLLYLVFPLCFFPPASLRWRCGQSSLYYCILMFPLRFAGNVASHLFIIVFNVPASLLPARFASLAMWPVVSLLLYSMFPLRFSPPASLCWRCGQSSLYYCIQCSRFAGDVASHLFIIVFNVPASLCWQCGQSSLYYCIQCSRFASPRPLCFAGDVPIISLLLYFMFPLRFAGDVASRLFINVFNVPASLRWRCGQSSLYYCI